jgi:hypothetical protein
MDWVQGLIVISIAFALGATFGWKLKAADAEITRIVEDDRKERP